jgi:hypothetical protein
VIIKGFAFVFMNTWDSLIGEEVEDDFPTSEDLGMFSLLLVANTSFVLL